MKNKIFSTIFLLTGVLIGLGSLGHSFWGVQQIYAGLANSPINSSLVTLIYVVWHFAGGCMATFGVIIVWVWFRVRKGERNLLFIPLMISVFYFVNGVSAVLYTGDPFFTIFIVLGGLLFFSSLVLKK